MTKYQAAVFPAPNVPIEIREFPEPELEPGAALLHTMYSEVCGTDVHLHHGKLAGVPYPIIPGHVSVGTVAKVRGTIKTVEGDYIKEGDVVTFLDVHETCYNCYYCLVANQPTKCPHRKVYGITYSASEGLLGGWSEAIYMKPGVKMIHIPKDLAPETFIGGGCGLVTALHAIDLCEIRLGESVAVLGVGPVGQSAVALASLSGAGEIVAVDGVADRLEFSKKMGATSTISLETPRPDRLLRAHALTHSRGFDVVVECSGNPHAVSEALDLVRDGGRVVVCGHYTDSGSIEINPHWQINRAVTLAASTPREVGWAGMVSGTHSINNAAVAVHAVESRRNVKALIQPGLK
jgi:D-arabinose 1-dehydrogenase-like Zn-dependent alcohol dehydrogenase